MPTVWNETRLLLLGLSRTPTSPSANQLLFPSAEGIVSFACPLTQSDADQRRGRLAVRGGVRLSALAWRDDKIKRHHVCLRKGCVWEGGIIIGRGSLRCLASPDLMTLKAQGPSESRGTATRHCASNQQGVAHALNVASPQLSRPGSLPAADSRFQAVPLAVPFRHPADGFSPGVLWGATTSTRPGAPLMCRFDFISERPISGLICCG